MKNTKLYLALLILGTITFAFGLYVYSLFDEISLFHLIAILVVAILVIVGIIIGIKRLKDEKQGLPPEDELSKRIKTKAGAMAFIYSFYVWLIILVFTMDSHINRIEVPLGIGLFSMGALYLMFWAHYSNIGVDDANPH